MENILVILINFAFVSFLINIRLSLILSLSSPITIITFVGLEFIKKDQARYRLN